MSRIAPIVLILLMSIAFLSCSEDPQAPVQSVDNGYNDLSKRDHVLVNLERAYTERNISQYDRLLAVDFEFFFSQQDIDDGLVGDASWGRGREVAATTNMFNRIPGDGAAPIDDINLALDYVPGENNWTLEEGMSGNHPGEDWYLRTIKYNMQIRAGEDTFVSDNIGVSFIIRLDNLDGKDIYRIIAWRDDI